MTSSFDKVVNSNSRVLIDFYADWCGPCRTLAPILKQVKDELGDDIKIFKIDVDKNPRIASKYHVRGVPTLLLFSDGVSVWRQSRVLQKNELINIIKRH